MALYASMAMILPLRSSSLTWVFGMRSLKFTPKTTPLEIMMMPLIINLRKSFLFFFYTKAFHRKVVKRTDIMQLMPQWS